MRIKERIRKAMKENLPYGRYVLKDGGTVLFNRHYRPIYERDRWVQFAGQEWFYNDGNPPWYDNTTLIKCLEIIGGRTVTEADVVNRYGMSGVTAETTADDHGLTAENPTPEVCPQ